MESIPGVSIRLEQDRRTLQFEEDGFLTSKPNPGQVCIRVEVEHGRNVVVVNVDGKKNAVPMSDKNRNRPGATTKLFRMDIPVLASEPGSYFTRHSQNNMHLLQLASCGVISLYELAVITQVRENRNFFLTLQRNYEARFYQNGTGIVSPHEWLSRWPDMLAIATQLLSEKKTVLPPLSEFHPEPEPTAVGLGEKQGRVLWYNLSQQLGAIITSGGRIARVHWQNISLRAGSRLIHLEKGKTVNFTYLGAPINTWGRETRFKLEAFGITLAS